MDIDECKARTSGCSLNADCHNNKGGWECECFVGFRGDGTNCFDIDECIENIDECGDHSTCLNTVGLDLTRFSMTSGYSQFSENPFIGSYLCECNQGFYKKQNTRHVDTCENINECDGSAFDNSTAIHNCDKNADCIDLVGTLFFYCDHKPKE